MANDWHTEYGAFLSYMSCKDTFYWVFVIILTQKTKVKYLYYIFSLRVKPKWKKKILMWKYKGLPWWLRWKESACNAGDLGVWKISWRRAWLPTPAFLPREFHGKRSLLGCSPWGNIKDKYCSFHLNAFCI